MVNGVNNFIGNRGGDGGRDTSWMCCPIPRQLVSHHVFCGVRLRRFFRPCPRLWPHIHICQWTDIARRNHVLNRTLSIQSVNQSWGCTWETKPFDHELVRSAYQICSSLESSYQSRECRTDKACIKSPFVRTLTHGGLRICYRHLAVMYNKMNNFQMGTESWRHFILQLCDLISDFFLLP